MLQAYCLDSSVLPDPASAPAETFVYYNNNTNPTGWQFIQVCSGRWITLRAEAGVDYDTGAASNPSLCGSCPAGQTCARVWWNGDGDYQWNISNVADQKGPLGNNKEIVYIKLRHDADSIPSISVKRTECGIAPDATPPPLKSVMVFASLINFERYPKVGYYTGISTSGMDSKLVMASRNATFKDDFGIDPCQANPLGVGCAGQNYNGANWGVHCCAGLRLAANVSFLPFTTAQKCVLGFCTTYDLGSIDSPTEEDLLFSSTISGNIKVVNSCGFCDGSSDGVIACTLTGSDHTIIPAGELNTVRMIHEWGHSAGIEGHFNDPIVNDGNFMSSMPSTGIVMQGQCNALLNGISNTVWP